MVIHNTRGALRVTLVALLLAALTAHASPPPYRGSALSLRNDTSVRSFDKSADQTYNPTSDLSVGLRFQWFFIDPLAAYVSWGFSHELTEADGNTFEDETVVQDVNLGLSSPSFYRIPGAGIDLSAGLNLTLPASKYSRARTLYIGATPSFSLARTFDVLSGIGLGYTFRGGFFFHEFTTGELASSRISSCLSGPECESFLNTGVRNVQYRLSNQFRVWFAPADWVRITASAGLTNDYLYALEGNEAGVRQAVEPNDRRDRVNFGLDVTFTPMKSLAIALGAVTVNNQLALDGEYEDFGFNRYTRVYLELSLDVAGLVTQITQ